MTGGGELPLDTLLASGDERRGPGCVSLLTGEQVAMESDTTLTRRGRSGVRVCLVGDESLGWLEVLEAWGATIEALVIRGSDQLKDTRQLLTVTASITDEAAAHLPPRIE